MWFKARRVAAEHREDHVGTRPVKELSPAPCPLDQPISELVRRCRTLPPSE